MYFDKDLMIVLYSFINFNKTHKFIECCKYYGLFSSISLVKRNFFTAQKQRELIIGMIVCFYWVWCKEDLCIKDNKIVYQYVYSMYQ